MMVDYSFTFIVGNGEFYTDYGESYHKAAGDCRTSNKSIAIDQLGYDKEQILIKGKFKDKKIGDEVSAKAIKVKDDIKYAFRKMETHLKKQLEMANG